jgi:hypothetical protein
MTVVKLHDTHTHMNQEANMISSNMEGPGDGAACLKTAK